MKTLLLRHSICKKFNKLDILYIGTKNQVLNSDLNFYSIIWAKKDKISSSNVRK